MMKINRRRRMLLRGMLSTGVMWVVVGAGAFATKIVQAAWPKQAFGAKALNDAKAALFGSDKTVSSDRITIKAPDIAENGAVVPVTVSADIKGVEQIAILVEKNPQPLAANFELSKQSEAYVATRIKMGKTSNVVALVKSRGKVYSAQKEIKVTIGGCGG